MKTLLKNEYEDGIGIPQLEKWKILRMNIVMMLHEIMIEEEMSTKDSMSYRRRFTGMYEDGF
jgi:hypothetical protein